MRDLTQFAVVLTKWFAGQRRTASSGIPAALLLLWIATSVSEGQQSVGLEKLEHPPRLLDLHGDPLPAGAIARIGSNRFRHGFLVKYVAFSPGGKTLVSVSGDNTIREWDMATGRQLRLFHHRGLSSARGFSYPGPNNTLVYWQDNDIRLFDLEAGKDLMRIRVRDGPVHGLDLSPDRKYLAWTVNLKTLYLKDLTTEQEYKMESPVGLIQSVAFAHKRKILATAGRTDVHLWELTPEKEFRKVHALESCGSPMAFSPDDKYLATAKEKHILLWDVRTGRQVMSLRWHTSSVTCLLFTPDDKTLISAEFDRTIRFWDVATGKETREISLPQATTPTCMFLSEDGRTLAVGGSDGAVRFWNIASGEEIPKHPAPRARVAALAFSRDSRLLVTAGSDRTLCLSEAKTGRELWTRVLNEGWGLRAATFSPDGKMVACALGDRTARLFEVASGQQLSILRGHQEAVIGLGFSPDGKVLITASTENTIRQWDVATSRELRRTTIKYGPVEAFAVCSDGKVLATANREPPVGKEVFYTVRLWDAEQLIEIANLPALSDWARSLIFSAGGSVIAAVCLDKTVTYWDLITNEEIRTLIDFPVSSPAIAFSPKAELLATGTLSGSHETRDGRTRFWNVATGKQLLELDSQSGGVPSLAYSPDGKLLATATAEGPVLIWDLTQFSQVLKRPMVKLTPERLDQLWTDLECPQPKIAYAAMEELAGHPEATIPFLQRRLHPSAKPDLKRIAQLIADFDSDRFNVRQDASRELEKLGADAEPSLRKSLEGKLSVEARSRIEILLQIPWYKGSPDVLRRVRAVQVVERIDSSAARSLLVKLAAGWPDARDTKRAATALQRLGKGSGN